MRILLFTILLFSHFCYAQQHKLQVIVPAGHSRPVTTLAISPDDRLLFSGAGDKLVKLWNTETGKLLKTFDEIHSPIQSIYISSSGKYFVTMGSGMQGVIREVASGAVVDSIKVYYNQDVISVKDADGFYWLGETKQINRWSPGVKSKTIDDRAFLKVEMSPDGNYLLGLAAVSNEYYYDDDFTFSEPMMAILIDAKTGVAKQLRKVKGSSGRQLAFSADGKLAIVGDDGNTVYAFSTATGQQVNAAKNIIFVDEIQTSALSPWIRIKCYDGLTMWDPVKSRLRAHDPVTDDKAFDNTGLTLERLGAVFLRKTYDSLALITEARAFMYARPLPWDSTRYAIPYAQLQYDAPLYATMSPYIYYSAKSAKDTNPYLLRAEVAIPFNVSNRVATAAGSIITITDADTWKREKVLKGLDLYPSNSISFSADNKHLVYSGYQVNMWNLETGRASVIRSDSGTLVKFATDKILVEGMRGRIAFRDRESGAMLHTLASADENPFGMVTDISVSADRKYLLWRDDQKRTFLKKVNWDELSFYPFYKQLNSSIAINNSEKTDGAVYQLLEFPGSLLYSFGKKSNSLLAGVTISLESFQDVSILEAPVSTWLQSPVAQQYPRYVQGRRANTISALSPERISVSGDSRYAIAISEFARRASRYNNRIEKVLYFLDLNKGPMPGMLSAVTWMDADLAGLDVAGFSTSAKHFVIKPVDCAFHPTLPWFAVSDAQNAIRTFSAPDYTELKPFTGHTDQVVAMVFSSDGRWLATASRDNSVKLWDTESRKELATLITFGEKEWVVLHPSGLFDASAGAMAEIYFTSGTQTIGLEQIKERFYEPNLIKKIIAGERLREVSGLDRIDLFPDIEALLDTTKAALTIRLSDQGGGIGKTSLFINGKETVEDVRSLITAGNKNSKGTVSVTIDLSTNKHLVWGDLNFIGVKSHNAAGYLASPVKRIFYTAPQKEKMLRSYAPHLYALIVGVSDYENDQLDLKYSSKDAADFYTALQTAGKRLFQDRMHISLLNSESADATQKPHKRNIIRALESIASNAQTGDVLVMYFSGHGTNQGGDDGDFLYLTPEARGFSFTDPVIREACSISGTELTGYLKMILAQKQVLIFDACASGRVVDDMLAKRDVPSSTLRALERMKDRAGTYILTGCAADAVSYEATQFGQGLLTYSVLSGIRGGALRENRFVDVMRLFNYAKEEVPKLAGNVGGIQEPKVFSPYGAESFDLGIIEPADRGLIPLTEAKPFFVRSSFQNETRMRDDLGLGKAIDESLTELANQGKGSPLIFLDTFEFPAAYALTGRYKNDGNNFSVKMVLFKNDREIKTFEKTYNIFDAQVVSKDLVELMMKSL